MASESVVRIILDAKAELQAGDAVAQAGMEELAIRHRQRAARLLLRAIDYSAPADASARMGVKDAAIASVLRLMRQGYPAMVEKIEEIAQPSWRLENPKREEDVKKLRKLIGFATQILRDKVKAKRSYYEIVTRYAIELLIVASFIIGTITATTLTEKAYERLHPLPKSGQQDHYYGMDGIRPLGKRSLVYWSALGKDGQLVNEVEKSVECEVSLKGFGLGRQWQRPIYWHVDAVKEGYIRISCPSFSVTHVALFMTDGDSIWRMSRLRSASDEHIADRLHDGRWFSFPLTAQEQRRGKKQIKLNQWTGDNISVSAIAAFSMASGVDSEPREQP